MVVSLLKTERHLQPIERTKKHLTDLRVTCLTCSVKEPFMKMKFAIPVIGALALFAAMPGKAEARDRSSFDFSIGFGYSNYNSSHRHGGYYSGSSYRYSRGHDHGYRSPRYSSPRYYSPRPVYRETYYYRPTPRYYVESYEYSYRPSYRYYDRGYCD